LAVGSRQAHGIEAVPAHDWRVMSKTAAISARSGRAGQAALRSVEWWSPATRARSITAPRAGGWVGRAPVRPCRRRIEPITRSTYGLCQGARGALTTSLISKAATRRESVARRFRREHGANIAAPRRQGKALRICCGAGPVGRSVTFAYTTRRRSCDSMSMQRFTRLTNGFSKHWRTTQPLSFMYYNFTRVHQTLRG
jgi:hypothetical protein